MTSRDVRGGRCGSSATARREECSRHEHGASGSPTSSKCGRSWRSGERWPVSTGRRRALSPGSARDLRAGRARGGRQRARVVACSSTPAAAVAGPLVKTFTAKDPVDLARAIELALATPLDPVAAARAGRGDELGAGVRSRVGRFAAALPVATHLYRGRLAEAARRGTSECSRGNWRRGASPTGHRYGFTCPSPPRYRHQWYWDRASTRSCGATSSPLGAVKSCGR